MPPQPSCEALNEIDYCRFLIARCVYVKMLMNANARMLAVSTLSARIRLEISPARASMVMEAIHMME